jgi:hypothetical protein
LDFFPPCHGLWRSDVLGVTGQAVTFCGLEKSTPSNGGAVEAGVPKLVYLVETSFSHNGQEILSRYCPPLSSEPAGEPGLRIQRRTTYENLIGHKETTARFEDSESLL